MRTTRGKLTIDIRENFTEVIDKMAKRKVQKPEVPEIDDEDTDEFVAPVVVSEPAGKLHPALQQRAQVITIEIPVQSMNLNDARTCFHIDSGNFTHEMGKAAMSVLLGMIRDGTTLRDGRPVDRHATVVKYILEQVAVEMGLVE